MNNQDRLEKFGLYDCRYEHDSCGVGFVCDIKGRISCQIIAQGLSVLNRLSHRGATGADPETGDGAGILIQIPHEFFEAVCPGERIKLPEPGAYGVGLVFLPQDAKQRRFCKEQFTRIIKEEGQILLGWRMVPVDSSTIGKTARDNQPVIEQVFIARDSTIKDQLAFECKLYCIRKQVETLIHTSSLKQKAFFYITNLSCRTLIYKGLLMPSQMDQFFLDLKDARMKSALCLVHSRYSTNTFPTWDLAQPFRFLAHNGEINTLRGNINWMRAKERMLESKLFGKDIKKLKPVIVPGGSDSASLDNIFELLVLSGRSLEHTMSMLIPAAWEHNDELPKELKSFYCYHACLMEPWDGPAAIAFTDGTRIGAILDRNGLRPARYLVTKDDLVVMASEVGVADIPPERIRASLRLEPGKIFFVDTQEGRIVDDAELKHAMAIRKPYAQWLKNNLIELKELLPSRLNAEQKTNILPLQKAFGYSREDLKTIIGPMAESGQEPVGSMGNDIPCAVLSNRNKRLYDYFKQLFAQVTNPAIDPLREEVVMSLDCFMGFRRNLLDETPAHSQKIHLESPILTNEELRCLKTIGKRGFKTKTISVLFSIGKNPQKDFSRRLREICREAEEATRQGYPFVVLSDRGVNCRYAALPMLLAVGAVHAHLVSQASRAQVALIIESAEPREVHHFALLFGYGAGAINPYLAYSSIEKMIEEKELKLEKKKALENYRKAVTKGIKKILSKMGISTLQSYRGAQIFEAVGLHQEVIQRYFPGTVSRIGGATLAVIAQETIAPHQEAFGPQSIEAPFLSSGGLYQWRRDGEHHLWNPESIAVLQEATKTNNPARYQEFARLINDQSKNPTTLRSIIRFKKGAAITLEQVESEEEIMKRFATGAMSFGSISRGTHESIAIAMNRIKGKSNTGEGGEEPMRFVPLPNGDSKRSAIKQVASGRFGVTTNYLINADELQIKIAQGAKPGEGGQLPGHKVSEIIARTRYTTPGVTLISPPPHHDIYSIEDLAQLIFDLKNVNPRVRISVKLVSEIGVGTIAAGVAKGHADMILISGGDGGTGASPLSSIKHAGLPWELGISETHQTLVLNDLRSRVRLQTDGQMRTGRDVAIAALLGAEEFGFCTAALIILGCVMLRHCHLNNCSVGVATQDAELEKRFQGNPDHLVNYFNFVARELREIMASLGVRSISEMVGRTDLLELNHDILPPKAKAIDYSRIFYRPLVADSVEVYCTKTQDHGIEQILDRELIARAQPALERKEKVYQELAIRNSDRTCGAMLSGEVCRRFGEEGLQEETIHFKFKGVAGQSFGAWLAKGVTFELEGLANDYVGKGISGGKIIIYPDKKATYVPQENILLGNTTFYGAITGEAYLCGVAGERFCIRNSGLYAVVEGVGDHGCEYMTGGRVVVLGATGRNFAAGMSGGVAYVYDVAGDFKKKCNLEMVRLEKLLSEDVSTVKKLLENHYRYTNSSLGKRLYDNFAHETKKFVKVMPIEYKRVLEHKEQVKKSDIAEVSDG
ncbi:MAG: glutamate synthase large subunit [Candidatus Omnitrophica bacterium]|nr:glutamate synthase large subunit [Candidatus Omnitrophota bacterium]